MKKETSVDQLLRELEDESIANSQKADILAKIIDIESEKPEADMDLIQECFDYLELLKNSEEEIASRKERIPYHLQRSYQKAADESAPFKSLDFSKIQQHHPIRKRRIRTIGVAAAIFVAVLFVTVSSLTAIAKANGYGNMWEWFSARLDEFFNLEPEKDHNIEGVTVIRGTDNKTYPSIELWIQEEKWDIWYPSSLPDNVRLDHILVNSSSDRETVILWAFNTQNIRLSAQNFDLASFEPTENMEIIEISGYHFGIFSQPDGTYQASCVIGDFAYSIECVDYEDLLFLINHLKGIKT